jgi:hypothetical protein
MKYETGIHPVTPLTWIVENLNLKKIPIEITTSKNGKIERLWIDKELNATQKKKLSDKFPELMDKECIKFSYE